MAGQIVKDHQIISVKQLVRAVQEGRGNAERFCFIIGSGASVSSGIPTGATLEYQWMKELEENSGLEEIRENAKKLKEFLDNDFAKIEADWKKVKDSGSSLPSEYYFDIYKLRFYPNHRNGYHYLEKTMANKNPGFGYHPLALMLTDGTGSNLVITTNFDSLIEDALFLYTDDKPLVINHELLAEYAGDANIKRPIIAKVHRGIFFDPLNQPDETNELKGRWRDVLTSVFQNYTPIVVGYGGGDNSLMNLLVDDSIKMKNGIYWCYYEKDGLPNDKIQTLIQAKGGCLVRTAGFDATMLAFGNALFPNRIGVHEAEEYLNKRTSARIANYEMEYKRLTELEHQTEGAADREQTSQSEADFKMEIEKMVERTTVSEKARQEQKQMTAWDYWRQGQRFYDLDQYKEAIENYSTAIKMQPHIAQFYIDRGCTYFDLEKDKEAIADFDQAIELDPKNSYAYNNRGFAYLRLGDMKQVILDFEKMIELDPESAMANFTWGIMYTVAKEYKRAMPYLNKAIELDPEFQEAYQFRAEAYRGLGKISEAEADEAMAAKL